MQRKAVLYDKGGDQHYDYISAWIKATRGSDPDASLYYLAAMLEGGEDAALHRAADGHPRLRGHRQRRPAGARGRGRGGRTRSSTSGCPRRSSRSRRRRSTCRWRRSPTPRQARDRRGARRTSASTAPRRRRRRCATRGLPGGAQARARQSATTTRTTRPGHVNDQEHLPDGRRGPALLRARRRRAGAARAAGRDPAGARPASREPRRATTRIGRSYAATRGEDPRIAARRCTPRSATRARCSTSARAPGHYEPRGPRRSPRSSRRR